MANRLADGFDHLSARMRSHAGTEITYRRGAQTCSCTATQGATEHIGEDFNGTVVTGRTNDFLVSVADLEFDGIRVTPQRGDEILYERRGINRVFRVMTPIGRNCFTLVDTDLVYRIYTEEVENDGN